MYSAQSGAGGRRFGCIRKCSCNVLRAPALQCNRLRWRVCADAVSNPAQYTRSILGALPRNRINVRSRRWKARTQRDAIAPPRSQSGEWRKGVVPPPLSIARRRAAPQGLSCRAIGIAAAPNLLGQHSPPARRDPLKNGESGGFLLLGDGPHVVRIGPAGDQISPLRQSSGSRWRERILDRLANASLGSYGTPAFLKPSI